MKYSQCPECEAGFRGDTIPVHRCGQRLIRPEIGRFGVKHDYTGAHVLMAGDRLAEIREVYYRETPAAFMARLRHFNGEDAGEQALATLWILNREAR